MSPKNSRRIKAATAFYILDKGPSHANRIVDFISTNRLVHSQIPMSPHKLVGLLRGDTRFKREYDTKTGTCLWNYEE